MSIRVPALDNATLAAANVVGRWLAQCEGAFPPESEAELVVLAGNAVIPTIDAACRLAAEGRTLLISGGVGHSTPFLYAAIGAHRQYRVITTEGRTEAALLADIAHRFWNIPHERILIEDRSTNCGENARFSCALLARRGFRFHTGIVVQDPTMQRRTMATFARLREQGITMPDWCSYRGYTPTLRNQDGFLTFTETTEGIWSVGRYLSLLLGELPRLWDDAYGYGPRGKGFIAHVDFPQQIQTAWQQLRDDEQLQGALRERTLGT